MGLLKMFELKDGQSLSILNDPFKKECVAELHIHWYSGKYSFSNGISGSVEFKNGTTSGVQKFTGETIADIVQKMESFINSL